MIIERENLKDGLKSLFRIKTLYSVTSNGKWAVQRFYLLYP